MMLKQKITWPVPINKRCDFVPVELELKQNRSRFILKSNRNLPPLSFIYTNYKACARTLDDPLKHSDLVRQKKLMLIIDRVKNQIIEAKSKLKEILLGYQEMVVKNKQKTECCTSMIVKNITLYKVLKKVHKRYMMASHSLLYIKDSMEEAVETYGESAAFMEEVARQIPEIGTVYDVYRRYQELARLREELGRNSKEETEKHASLLHQLAKRHEDYYDEAKLLHIRGKELDTALRDLDCRLSRDEQFMYEAHLWNERAWRQYSFINLTLFDIMKYLIDARNLSPEHLKVSLWDKIQFIRREHKYNLEILRRAGVRESAIDLDKILKNEHHKRKMEEESSKMAIKKLKEIRKKFRGNVPHYFKQLFKKLRISIEGSTKTSQELLNMICEPKNIPD